jgi:hypothetical protein
MKTVIGVSFLVMALNLAFWGGLIVVALHFVQKFW